MSWHKEHPRAVAAGAAAIGALILLIIVAKGGVTMPKSGTGKTGAIILGLGGICLGVGLSQLVWPPRRDADDGRTAFGRAPWPQKLLWIFGGMVGVVIAAVVQTFASGKY